MMRPLYSESDPQSERNANGVLRQLRHSLQMLASEAQDQASHFPQPYFFSFVEEMLSDFDHWANSVQSYWKLSQEQTTRLMILSNFLKKVSWSPDFHVGPDITLFADPQWDQIRMLAKDALTAFGWPIEVPPPAHWINGILIDGA